MTSGSRPLAAEALALSPGWDGSVPAMSICRILGGNLAKTGQFDLNTVIGR